MKHFCPQCQQQVEELVIRCGCGWELSDVLNESLSRGLSATAERKIEDIVVIPVAASRPDTDSADAVADAATASQLPVELELTQARQWVEQGDFSKALAGVNRALAASSVGRRADCLALKGYILYRNGELEKSELACTEALAENWEDARTFSWRAAARGEQNKWRLAFEDLHQACELAAPENDEYLSLMEKYLTAARRYFRQTIKDGSATADTLCDRGWVYLRCNKLRKAERDLKNALATDINHRWAAMGLALTHQAAGVVKHLEPLLNSAIEGPLACRRMAFETSGRINFDASMIAATDHDLHHLHRLARGDTAAMIQGCRLRAELGFPIRSTDILTKLLKKNPEAALGWLVRGECYAAIKSYALACKDFTRFLEFRESHVGALNARADALLAMQKYNLAHQDVQLVLDAEPANHRALLTKAKIYLAQDQLNEALAACHEATRAENAPSGFAVKAEIYHQLGNYTESFEEYSRAIMLSREPQQKAEYLYRRGAALYELAKFDNAYEDFRHSIKLRPNHSGALIWKAATCARLEKWHLAILALQTAVATRPAVAEQYHKLGKPVARKAVEFFNAQQQRSPQMKNLHRYRAMAQQFLGNLESAVTDCSAGLQTDPVDTDLMILRAQAYAALGDHELACEDLAEVIQRDPVDHLAFYLRACSQFALRRLEHARSDLRRAIKIAPNQAKYHLLRGRIHLSSGENKKATRAFDKAIVHDPTDPLIYRERAGVYLATGRYRRAIRDYSHANELAPGQAEVLQQRGLAYMRHKQLESALEDFEAALVIDPRSPKAYRGRASILAARGQQDYGVRWLTKAIHRFEDDQDLVEILYARGKAFAQMGRWYPSIGDFSSIIHLMRDDPRRLLTARHARGLTNIHAGRYEKAAKDFRRIRRMLLADAGHGGDGVVGPAAAESIGQVDQILNWLERAECDASIAWLEILGPRIKPRTPVRPPAIRRGVKLDEATIATWQNEPPYDSWIVRTAADREYGPVRFPILTSWLEDGRIDIGMKLLRADWNKWKAVETVFPDILPSRQKIVEDFPGIQV